MNWKNAFLVWLLIAVAESLHGTLRRLFLVPLIGERPSSQVGVVIGSVIIFVIAWFCIRWIATESYSQQMKAGILWVFLTLIFEFSLGFSLGYSLERILSDYNLREGGLMGLGLLFMMFAPFLAARVRRFTHTS